MKNKVVTYNNYDWEKMLKAVPKNTGKSLTMPDQYMSIQDMLKRHAAGLPQPGGIPPVEFTTDPYDETDDYDDHDFSEFDDEFDVIDAHKEGRREAKRFEESFKEHLKQIEYENSEDH